MTIKTLRIILGDQLSENISALADIDKKNDTVLMMEVSDESTHVPQHPKKLVFILSAMRHFAESLQAKEYTVDYIKLDSEASKNNFTDTLADYLKAHSFDKIVMTEASEYRVLTSIQKWQDLFATPIDIRDDDRFFCTHKDFDNWAQGKKQLLMENFYRMLRKETGLLMHNNKPVGEQWNFDKDNRKTIKGEMVFPRRPSFSADPITQDVITLVQTHFNQHFGDIEPFDFAVTRQDAGKVFKHFIQFILPLFGDYQDAMQEDEYFLYHSVISHYINIGFLDPRNICKAAEIAYQKGDVPINAAEGFIRQILGWREYIRGIYWLKMPRYAESNFFENTRALPELYWGKPTQMKCLSHVVKQTKESAYSHHIQRLMVSGNFAMLIGVSPQALHKWYLAVYADAYEWVELPNTIGMATFSDGGIVGSKPYAASGAYINKMSNFCKSCTYKVKEKTGKTACPFNYLYWHFLIENRDKLASNHRMGLAYKNVERFSPERLSEIKHDSEQFIKSLYK